MFLMAKYLFCIDYLLNNLVFVYLTKIDFLVESCGANPSVRKLDVQSLVIPFNY